jgi:hypothetical protein
MNKRLGCKIIYLYQQADYQVAHLFQYGLQDGGLLPVICLFHGPDLYAAKDEDRHKCGKETIWKR